MFNRRELSGLITTMHASGVTTLELNKKDRSLRIELPLSGSSSARFTGLSMAGAHAAKSCINGVFLRRGVDDGLSELELGMRVNTGEILGYVCHGSVRTIINAPVGGVLADQGPKNNSVLGFGDTVFNVVPT